ncbi:RNA-binding protein [Candidatus Woesearchaeota archaeon]|nr:RNA-binding protein [Candidatus Woesearchaeota archaeon]
MRKQLRKSEIRDLNTQIEVSCGITDFFSKKDAVETDGEKVMAGGVCLFLSVGGRPVPTLRNARAAAALPRLVVDRGAVRFMASGADVMRPGIVRIDDAVREGGTVLVVDEQHGKGLCIARSLYDADAMRSLEKGKAAASLHHVGDAYW